MLFTFIARGFQFWVYKRSTACFDNLFKYEWALTRSPVGARQWKERNAPATIPDA